MTTFLDRIGYDAYDVGPLAQGPRFQRDTAAYAGLYAVDAESSAPRQITEAELKEALTAAQRYADR